MLELGDALEQARAATTDWACDDAAGRVAAVMSHFALARIHYLESSLGSRATARCLVGPDSSPSRNPDRLASGFSTGGEVWWEAEDLVVLDMLPNCCGMTLARIAKPRILKAHHEALERLVVSPITVNGHRVEIDLDRKNHFLSIFEDEDGHHYAVVHCSAPEFRVDGNDRMGLNRLASARLRSAMSTLETPAGPIHYLVGARASEFYAVAREAAAFAEAKRREILARVFDDDVEIVYGAMHQGYYEPGRVALGSQIVARDAAFLFLLGPYESAFLVGASPGGLPAEHAVVGHAPHGGGYRWAADVEARVTFDSGEFLFELTARNGAVFLTRSLDSIPFLYRGEESLTFTETLIGWRRQKELRHLATLRN